MSKSLYLKNQQLDVYVEQAWPELQGLQMD